jgi:hypothetical protein
MQPTHRVFVQILQTQYTQEDSIQIKRRKLSVCMCLYHIHTNFERQKPQGSTLITEVSDEKHFLLIHSKMVNSAEQVIELVDVLWHVIRNESANVEGRRQPTLLTSNASDVLLVLLYHVSQDDSSPESMSNSHY